MNGQIDGGIITKTTCGEGNDEIKFVIATQGCFGVDHIIIN